MSIRNLIDAVPMPVIEVDAKDRIRSANTAAEQLIGAGRERLRERTLPEWLPPDRRCCCWSITCAPMAAA